MSYRPRLPVALAVSLSLLAGCGDDGGAPGEDNQTAGPVAPPSPTPPIKPPDVPPVPEPPKVYKEETDQSQEYFKEQHDTSFSHVHKKNWFSFTAGKSGVLTRISLYCKPHFPTSSLYGKVMKGVIREGNPELGRKLGEWSLSRDEVVAQLAAQGLTEVDYGWVDVKMLGEVPQKPGTMYYFVCTSISEGKHWFGAIAFAENNTYPDGRHWLHPEHDLVFRTYVGQLEEPPAVPTPPAPPEANVTEEPAPETNVTPLPEPQSPEPKPPAAPEGNVTLPAPAPEANATTPAEPETNVPAAPAPEAVVTEPEAPAVPTPGPPQPRIRNVAPSQGIPQALPGELPPDFKGSFPPPPASPDSNATSPFPGGALLPGLFPSPRKEETKPEENE